MRCSRPASKEDFVAAVRALDRVLISGDYMVPMQHQRRAVDRLLEPAETSGKDARIRLSAAGLVGARRMSSDLKRARQPSIAAHVPRMLHDRPEPDDHRRRLRRRLPVVLSRQEAAGKRARRRCPTSKAEIRWRPFQLDPTIPPQGKDRKRTTCWPSSAAKSALSEIHANARAARRGARASTSTSTPSRFRPTRSTRTGSSAGRRRRATACRTSWCAALFQPLFRRGRQYRRPWRAGRGRARSRHGRGRR